jgi:hypothetical protein
MTGAGFAMRSGHQFMQNAALAGHVAGIALTA